MCAAPADIGSAAVREDEVQDDRGGADGRPREVSGLHRRRGVDREPGAAEGRAERAGLRLVADDEDTLAHVGNLQEPGHWQSYRAKVAPPAAIGPRATVVAAAKPRAMASRARY